MPTVIQPFVQRSTNVNATIMNILNDKLALPKGTLESLHSIEEHSGSEARIIKNPPKPQEEANRAIGAHTDFGSLVCLHIVFQQSNG
jgi:isopenicillin N synthase-like dioxygenase